MAEFDWDADFRREQARVELTIRDLALEVMRLEHQALEEMAERMLVSDPPAGIAVVLTSKRDLSFEPDLDGVYRMEDYRQYRLDPGVPFGHIYEFPSIEAYEVWHERGCPRPV